MLNEFFFLFSPSVAEATQGGWQGEGGVGGWGPK